MYLSLEEGFFWLLYTQKAQMSEELSRKTSEEGTVRDSQKHLQVHTLKTFGGYCICYFQNNKGLL